MTIWTIVSTTAGTMKENPEKNLWQSLGTTKKRGKERE